MGAHGGVTALPSLLTEHGGSSRGPTVRESQRTEWGRGAGPRCFHEASREGDRQRGKQAQSSGQIFVAETFS